MPRVLASVALALLLVVSLAAKAVVYERSDPGDAPLAPDTGELFLLARDFAVTPPVPETSPPWFIGERDGCHVAIATVSAFGWDRSAVAFAAAGQVVRFVYRGAVYDEQPVLRTKVDAYWHKALDYLGASAGPVIVRAVLTGPGCPDDLLGADAVRDLSH
jgi:hypothetical protein